MNKAILMGNLGEDPELRFTQGGTAVLNLRMATSEKYKDKDTNEWKEATEWHSIVIWGKRAEGLAPHVSKGTKLLIEGRIQTRSYDDRDGNKRYKTEINADKVEFASSKGSGGGRGQQSHQQSGGGGGSTGNNWDDDDDSGDIPF